MNWLLHRLSLSPNAYYSYRKRREKAKTKEDGLKYGVEIAHDIKEKISSYVNGYQISAPFGKVDIALEVIK